MNSAAELELHKLPPQNIEAEQMVLGAIIIDNEAIEKIIDILVESDFYKDVHRRIYASMVAMSQSFRAIDLVTLTDEIRGSAGLESVGGASYLASLVSFVPTSANIKHHARIVREKSILRQLAHATQDINGECYSETKTFATVDELLDHAEGRIFSIAQKKSGEPFSSVGSLLHESMETIERVYEHKDAITGVATGFVDLDRKTTGLQPGDLIIIAGRPSMGKTAFCLNIACYVSIEQQKSVAFFSLEMSKEQLVLRSLCSEARVDMHKVRTGYLSERDWPRLSMASGRLADAPLYIDDTAALSILELRSKARRLKADKGLDLVIVDYLQLMRGNGDADNREQEISNISRSLKALAKELKVPVIALSQLNRAVESRGKDKRPMLSDLRESGAIEQDSDVIMFIYREEVYQKCECPQDMACICGRRGTAEAIIGKQRQGPIGTVDLTFINAYTRFENAVRNSH